MLGIRHSFVILFAQVTCAVGNAPRRFEIWTWRTRATSLHATGSVPYREISSNAQGGTLMSRTRIPLSRQDEQARLMKERLEMSTAEIGLTVRTTNCLEERGIFTVRDLLHSTPDQLLSIANFGEKTLEEVYKSLEKIGFYRASKQAKAALV